MNAKDWQGILSTILNDIEHADKDYPKRYELVFEAVEIALKLGHPSGIRIDPAEPEWPVVYIELPTGQVSWHMPQHPVPYDGHTTEQKYERTRAYIGGER
ncbi:MAG: hypothetical protein V4515_12600 [Chloroflexota bacterium]